MELDTIIPKNGKSDRFYRIVFFRNEFDIQFWFGINEHVHHAGMLGGVNSIARSKRHIEMSISYDDMI